MRFHPKRPASIEKAPGPINAKAIPMEASKILVQGSPGRARTLQSSRIATRNPAIGVQMPTSRDRPIAKANTSAITHLAGGTVPSLRKAWLTKPTPATTRKNKSPIPGHPRAKFENNLRKALPCPPQSVMDDAVCQKPPKSLGMTLLSIRELLFPVLSQSSLRECDHSRPIWREYSSPSPLQFLL
jgi:hypothetical protein